MRGFVLSDCVWCAVCEWKERGIEVRISFGPLTAHELAFQTCKIWALYNSSSSCLLGEAMWTYGELVIVFQGLDDIFQLLQGALHNFDSFRIPKDNISPFTHLTGFQKVLRYFPVIVNGFGEKTLSVQATITNNHRLSGLNNRHFFLTLLETGKV